MDLFSKEVQTNKSDAIQKLRLANPLGLVDDNKSLCRRCNNKKDNTLRGQPICNRSQANANRLASILACKSLLETTTVVQDGMPLEDWDNYHLEETVKSLYDATALANALNALRQDIAYTPFGTSFKYKDPPEQQ